MSIREHLGRGASRGTGGGGRYTQAGATEVTLATVGHGEDGVPWAWTEGGQILVHITYQTGDIGQQGTARIADGVMHLELVVGQQVIVVRPNGTDTLAVIVGALHDLEERVPTSVAGVATGATTAATRDEQSAAPAFTFIRTGSGRMLAIETRGADVLVHAGSGVEIAAAPSSAIHLRGAVHVGYGFATAPVGAKVGPEEVNGGIAAGTPGIPHTPVPLTIPVIPEPYAGAAEGVVRAKDELQSNPAIDPAFWTWWTFACAVTATLAGLIGQTPPPINPPTRLTSRAATASQALTAADRPPEE